MRVLLGDGIAALRGFAKGGIDLVLSDLPSGATSAEFDRVPDLQHLFAATWHALKPDGVAVFMASSLRFAAALMTAGGKTYRYDLVWEKDRATAHLLAKKRPLRAHEFVLVFTRQPAVYQPQMRETGKKQNPGSLGRHANGENYSAGGAVYTQNNRAGATDRYPRSVLRFNGVQNSKRIHPQQKPVDLLRWLVRSYSRPGELIADPFAGSGSTLVAAEAEDRRAIGWDSSPRFGTHVSNPSEPESGG